jgi:hypothetical protein
MGRVRYDRKTSLTFEERITAAFMHYVRDIDQQDIAMLYGVNMGRVNEACVAIRNAVQFRDQADNNEVNHANVRSLQERLRDDPNTGTT